MKTISIRELHQATGRWVRQAQAGEVYVTERGRLIARIVAASPLPAQPFFAKMCIRDRSRIEHRDGENTGDTEVENPGRHEAVMRLPGYCFGCKIHAW